jgi:hypothetical protein
MNVKFQETKQKKLKRMLLLRIMNTIGMIAWRVDSFGEAQQKIRMFHPLSWLWLLTVVLFGIFSRGIPETIRELLGIFKEETVCL